MSFLRPPLSLRWVALGVLALVAAALCVQAGRWQYSRYEERAERSELLRQALTAPALPAADVLSPSRRPPEQLEWRSVTATGSYDPRQALVVRNRSHEGRPGFHVLVPLLLADGTALLVDRGWRDAAGGLQLPAPPTGTVTVRGRLRLGGSDDPAAERRTDGPPPSVARVVPAAIATTLPYPVQPAYVELTEEQPPTAGLVSVPAPEPGEGPHLFYALQWYVFGAMILGGYVYLARQEARSTRSGRDEARPGANKRTAPATAEG